MHAIYTMLSTQGQPVYMSFYYYMKSMFPVSAWPTAITPSVILYNWPSENDLRINTQAQCTAHNACSNNIV